MAQLTKCPSCGTLQHITPNRRKKCDSAGCEQLLYLDLGFPDDSPTDLVAAPSKRASSGKDQLKSCIDETPIYPAIVTAISLTYIIYFFVFKILDQPSDPLFMYYGHGVNFVFITLVIHLLSTTYKDSEPPRSFIQDMSVGLWIISNFKLIQAYLILDQGWGTILMSGLAGIAICLIVTLIAFITAFLLSRHTTKRH